MVLERLTILKREADKSARQEGHVSVNGQVVHEPDRGQTYAMRRKWACCFKHGALFTIKGVR